MGHTFINSGAALVIAAYLCITGFLPSAGAIAEESSLPAPTGPVILTVKGNIALTNFPGEARFDYEQLARLGLVSEQIDTVWSEAGSLFEGVRTTDLMALLEATGSEVIATAANDYAVRIPLQHLTEFDTLLALSMNGKRMRLRDKGPVWILYSQQNRPKVPEIELNERMIWQLVSLEVI